MQISIRLINKTLKNQLLRESAKHVYCKTFNNLVETALHLLPKDTRVR